MFPRIQPCLWFDKNAQEAALFYEKCFPESRIHSISRAPGDYPSGQSGDVLVIQMDILGMPFMLLNGGPEFTFNEAVSFQVLTEDQEETDRFWDAIVSNGGQESACGWCKDRFGLSWQITPKRLMHLISKSDPAKSRAAFNAMMEMRKIDIAALDRAVEGAGADA